MPVYKQYYVLQKYKGNAPISPAEFKKGELYKIDNFNDASECVGQAPVETLYEWRKTDEYICDGTTSYYLEQQYYSVDSGVNWYPVYPVEYKWSTLRKENDEDCGGENPKDTVYRWVVTNGYVCDGTSKYTKEKRQYSTDGINWFDVSPEEIQKGTLIGYESVDCGYIAPITQWVGTDKTVCQGYDKYVIQKEQISYDGGTTWTDTGDTRIGNLIESNSYDCDYGVSWVEVENEYICEDAVYWVYPKGETELYASNSGFTFTLDHSDDDYDYYLIEGNGTGLQFMRTNVIGGSSLNTGNITDMYQMFRRCSNLISLDLSEWNVSSIMNMGGMFEECRKLTSLDLTGWDTSNVAYMGSMFSICTSLTSLNLSNFDTSEVHHMNYMFYYCTSLTSLNVSSFDTSNVTTMDSMFRGCSSLTSLDLSNFNTNNVTNMLAMFEGCSSLTSLDLSNFDTSNVNSAYDMWHMFNGCSSLATLDLSGWDMSSVTDISDMFYGCNALRTIYMRGCNSTTITKIETALTNAGIRNNVNIITE